jgi:hypothetical protein
MKATLAVTLNLDFALLKAEKRILNNMLDNATPAQHAALEGILSLIDHIQDVAVDECKIPETEVFSLEGQDGDITDDEAEYIVLNAE